MNIRTRIRSRAMRLMVSAGFLEARRQRARLIRKVRRGVPVVHYFHQVDDPYSHLAVQKLDILKSAYDIPFEVHLVSGPGPDFQGDATRFDEWAERDAASIAAAYETTLEIAAQPDRTAIEHANDILAAQLGRPEIAGVAMQVGAALWAGRDPDHEFPRGDGATAVSRGNALRRRLGHYLGAMFHFDGEWFWGVDRIRSLEKRLIDEGYGTGPILVPEPGPDDASNLNATSVTLEYFPSLRSPYTAVGHGRVVDLVSRSGVTLKLRPVMPMMMRGIPAPRAKQLYIITDAAREARARGVPFGRIVDPFGEPVRQAFALFPAAQKLGQGMAFITAYLSAAWAEGTDITNEEGLRYVAASAGIDWQALTAASAGTDWTGDLDDNLNDMLSAGLWGVPSFRVSGGKDDTPFACWGQDRIWRVEQEIVNRI